MMVSRICEFQMTRLKVNIYFLYLKDILWISKAWVDELGRSPVPAELPCFRQSSLCHGISVHQEDQDECPMQQKRMDFHIIDAINMEKPMDAHLYKHAYQLKNSSLKLQCYNFG